MQIFIKTLTGKSVQLQVGDVQIGPRRQDGSFLIHVGTTEVPDAVSARLQITATTTISISPL